MANNFTLTLDTTAPASPTISLEGGAQYATSQLVTASISTTDADTTNYQMIIWGDIDKSYDTNVQTQEKSIANPSTAPTLGASGTTSTLPAGTYYVRYTWTDGYGETMASPEASITTTSGQQINVTLPTFPTGTNIKAFIYIGTSTGTGNKEGETSTTTYVQSTALAGTVASPASNTLTGSTWVTYSTSKQLKLSATDGSKTAYIKIRDDVHNASSQASDGIILDTTLPIITITGPDVSKISKQTGKNVSSFSFTVDTTFDEYKVKVVASTGATHDTGTLIGTAGGSTNMSGTGTFSANTAINCSVYGSDLETASAGDGSKIVKVFAKDSAGNWSV